MRDSTNSLPTLATSAVLALVKELTIGQRTIDTVDQLADFLHKTIFPRLGPFAIEIYFPDPFTGSFIRAAAENHPAKGAAKVPEGIAAGHPLLVALRATGAAVDWSPADQPPLEPDGICHRAQLLVPVLDEAELCALLYLGSNQAGRFATGFIESLQTLAAVIGSRLKSMTSIRQLQESMAALEYSDRLRSALYEISEQAHCSEDITELYARLHQTVGRLIHARNFYIALVEEHQGRSYLTFPYFVDRNDTHYQGMALRLEPGYTSITGYLLKSRQPLLLTPDNFDEVCRRHGIECIGPRPHSWLGAPFFVDHIAGAVAVQSYRGTIYTEKDKELIAYVARHIGDALNRKRAVDELRKAKEKAEQAERNKSSFLANMSHEIRTPMNGILGLSELVLHSDISGQQRTYLEMIHSSADRLLKLINDILDFSKIEAGKLELNIAPFSLRHTLATTLEILAIGAAKKNIDLRVDCDEAVPDALLGDADKLSQILTNLVGNGVKFTNDGSVTLTVRLQEPLDVPSGTIGLQFAVKDTGIGIPEEKINNIFQAFSQVITTRTSGQRGTGLGLVIAGELVELMGGNICVESSPGVGTTFSFTVKFSPAPAEGVAARGGEPPPSTPRFTAIGKKALRILLVEDDYINRTLAVTVLERQGWEVKTAEHGLKAIAMAKDFDFDLILMDVELPELDGYQTTRNIRHQQQASGKHVPIIAMTAHAVKGDREKCLAAGMDGYLAKPIHADQLIREIETLLAANSPLRPSPRSHS